MPRDGSNIYSQPFPDVVEDTTIESTVYNGFTNDVAQDLNAPRPIVAGGTGATSADQALFNVVAEKSTQTVTNFNSHIWVPGSFRHVATPTDVGQAVLDHAFAGWCYIGEALANPPTNQNVVVHAFDLDGTPGAYLLYTRQKKAGVWSAWSITATGDQQAAARQSIYAAPFDALAYSGMQINGSMEVSQELGVSPTSTSGNYFCDGWRAYKAGTMVYAASSAVPSPTPGFNNFGAVVISTAQVSLGASDYLIVVQNIEGHRVSRLAWGTASAQSLTIGFWTAHARTGTYSVTVRNAADTRNYVTTYTQNVANAAEYKTVTIPGCTNGVWLTTNGIGMTLVFAMASGSTWTVPTANVWNTTGGFFAASGQVNGVAATSDIFRITGVVVLPGIEAPSAARSPLIMRPYDQELITCKRYWRKDRAHGLAGVYAASAWLSNRVHFGTEMRATPAVTLATVSSFNMGARSNSHILPTGVTVGGLSTAANVATEFIDDVSSDARL